MKPPPPKFLPPSGYVLVTPQEDLSRSRICPIIEKYPDDKGAIEEIIAAKWVTYLKKPGRIERRDDPDIIYREDTPNGEIVIPIELMELVSLRDASHRVKSDAYTRKLRQIDGLDRLSLSFCCEEMVKIPEPSKPEGKVLLEEIKEAILRPTPGKMPTGEMYPGSVGKSMIWNYVNSRLNEQSGNVVQIFLSIDGVPVGINYAPTEKDWCKWKKELNTKFLHDYSPRENPDYEKSNLQGPVLLLHGSHARPDFDRLTAIVDTLRTEWGSRFSEIWYLKLYPEGRDQLQLISP